MTYALIIKNQVCKAGKIHFLRKQGKDLSFLVMPRRKLLIFFQG